MTTKLSYAAATLVLATLATRHAAAEGDAAPGVPTDEATADMVRVFDCRFDVDTWDINYDGWPDGWTRLYDDEHPQYVRMGIEPVDDPSIPGRALVVHPDGASAQATSRPIAVMPKFSYKLRLRVRVSGVEHGSARVALAFHSPEEGSVQIESTQPLVSDGEWRDVELGDYQPTNGQTDRVYLHVQYDRGERGDLAAEIAIADVRLYRLPSIKIRTDSPYNIYTDARDVLVTCSLSGILEQNPEVQFQLLDATNQTIGKGGELTLDGRIIHIERTRASDIVDGFGSDKSSYEGETTWRPPIGDNSYGFYRVRVGMFSAETGEPVGEARSITLAIVRKDLETSERGEFGWSLPTADRPLDFAVLQELLPRVGVRMVKLPVWFPAGDERRGEQLMRFAEQLAARGIDTIGVLEDPTPRLADPQFRGESPPVEGLLSTDPSYWTPMIDHVITRLSLRIRWWQLGADGDTSFVGYDRLIDRLRAIRNQMFRFGQDIRIGIGWRWDHAHDWAKALSWDFEQMAGREQLDAAGLQSAFAKVPPTTAQRLVIVEPPDTALVVPEGVNAGDSDDPRMRAALVKRHQQRVRDFVEQILVAKINGADGIFIANPFSGSTDPYSGRTGVMNDDGTPGELLLPWRTCARLLGGAEYLGSLQLPNRSSNWLFKRPDGRVVMVLWNLNAPLEKANATPIEEELYLGDRVQELDVWGAVEEPTERNGRQVIRVGRMPRFVVGVNEAVARWRMKTRFESLDIASVFGVAQPNAIVYKNTFPQGVGGSLSVFVPAREAENAPLSDLPNSEWDVALDENRVSLAAGQSITVPVEVTLREASYGERLVRLDFAVTAEKDYRFSVWRNLDVGLEGVSLNVVTYLSDDGRLIVEQQMSKASGRPADFKCLLYAPNHRRKRAQVFQLGAEIDKKQYTYLNPGELIGAEMRLRIEEVDGPRVMIHRFRVQPQAAPNDDDPALDRLTRAGSA